MAFTNEEKRDIIQIYYKYDRNSVRTSEMYLNLYPERRQPHRTRFKLDRNTTEFGSFEKPRKKYADRMDQETKENLISEINMNPGKSSHQIFSKMNNCHTGAWRHLKKAV
ncbi:uncharacterized protein [Leptinotarsa decemlineata]|uniref:uncharacterized protein n=1 Tax=Leptinotarsa decemlineata TaxID=7539 RepID=UPI003D306AEF